MSDLRILVVEDEEDDFRLLALELRRSGRKLQILRVADEASMRAALREREFDVILSDWSLPGFSALGALAVAKESGLELPFIIVSGSIGEESAVRALKEGANDFVVKQSLARLGPAIERELRESKIRRERRDALADLERAVRLRDEFLDIASHELKTPLTSLQLQVQGLLRALRSKEGAPPEQIDERLRAVERNTKRMHELIERLLDITRVTSGGVPLDLQQVDLGKVAEGAAARFTDAGAGPRLQLEARGEVIGNWDEARLDTLATNLIANALKYGEGKPVRVSVGERDGDAVLVVRDEGIGIAEEDHQRIFERFGRAVSERKYGGFGIGLWLAQQIARAHGGRIELQSALGLGSTFTAVLPKAKPH